MNNGRDLRNSSRPGCMVHTSYRSVDLCITVHDVCVSNNHPPETRKWVVDKGKEPEAYSYPSSAQSGPRKKPGLSRNPRSSAPSQIFLKFIFDLKMASFDALLVVFYAI